MVSAICFVTRLEGMGGAADRHWRPIFDSKSFTKIRICASLTHWTDQMWVSLIRHEKVICV